MRCLWVLTLLLLLCGCLAHPYPVGQASAAVRAESVPSTDPAPAVAAALQMPVSQTVASSQDRPMSANPDSTPEEKPVSTWPAKLDPAQLLAVDPEAVEDNDTVAPVVEETVADNEFQLPSGDAADVGDELDENALPDPETLEDTQVLTDEGLLPPDDEGITTPASTVTFDFPVVENQKVQYYVDYFSGDGRKTFSRWLERSSRYIPYMQQIFAEEGLPLDLAYLSIVESGLNPKAYSWAHASGPWQFIRGTGKMFGLDNDWWRDERRDFEKSTRAAARYLKELHTFFDGNWYLAVAAYNAGAGKVLRAVNATQSRDFWEIARTRYILEETKNYIPKLLATLLIVKQPEKYGFTGLEYQPLLAYDKVSIPSSTDLHVISQLSGCEIDQIKALNPELKRWCTPPGVENYEIKLPVGSGDSFKYAFDELPAAERNNYAFYRVKKGDTLKKIAKRNDLTVDDILAVNPQLSSQGVKPGKGLVLPLRQGLPPILADELREDPVVVKTAKVKTYKVKKGDTLWKIAKRYGVGEKDLRRWNKLKAKAVLRPGQVLYVGTSKGRVQQDVAAASGKTAKSGKVAKSGKTSGRRPADKNAPLVYKVKKGDTLFRIAQRYDVSAETIRNWNNLPKKHTLQPGDRLTLHVQNRSGG